MLPSVRPVRLAPTGLAVLVAATCLAGLLPAAASAATVTPSVTREAESMVLTPSAGATFPDPQASGRAGLLLWSNGMARGGVVSSEPALAVRVTARGDQCGGAPTMRLVVDGAAVGTASVTSATWSTYTFPVQAPAGRHGFRIWFDNDHRDASCDRNLRLDRVDWLSLDTATAPSPTAPPAPVPTAPPAPVPTAPWGTAPLHVDPDSPARRAADARRGVDPLGAARLDKIAQAPGAEWFGDWQSPAQVTEAVRRRMTAAGATVPVLVAYALPHRDCGGYSAGGVRDAASYGTWLRAFADGIGDGRAVVVLEPDALAQLDCLGQQQQAERLAMLRDAGVVLAARDVTVYLDGGNSGWVSPEAMASRLLAAGVEATRGFATNVSNFHRTENETAYADRVAALTGGTHYVVDTSRNGLGPLSGADWCNPQGRALGVRPTTTPAGPSADAYLWIKRVGESDGDCGRGEPPAGAWWTEYALGLASRAAW